MLINKRPAHPVLETSGKLIDRWRHDLVAGLATDPEVAAYLLILAACSSIQTEGKAAIRAGVPSTIEHLVRSNLFALQFGLEVAKGLPSPRQFDEGSVAGSLDSTIMGKALKVHEGMKSYALVRDVFLGYYFGAYNIESDKPRQLVFVAVLAQLLAGFTGTGGAPVVERSDLVDRLRQATELSSNIVSRFLDLITFRSTDPAKLTLFHRPVVPLTRFTVQIVPPAVFGANITTTVLRLAVRRGPGLGTASKSLEAFLLGRLQQHFSGGGNVIRLGRKYSSPQDKGDIDFVAYEPSSKALTLLQAKTFIYPDSVPEVFDANEDIEKAISQLDRTRMWFNATQHEEHKAVLGLPELQDDAKVLFAVLANGFVGSEFLNPPEDVLLGDLRFLLRPEFQRISFQAALQSFVGRLTDLKSSISRMVGNETLHVGEVEIAFPAISFEIRTN